jgi:hypothetical protein
MIFKMKDNGNREEWRKWCRRLGQQSSRRGKINVSNWGRGGGQILSALHKFYIFKSNTRKSKKDNDFIKIHNFC